MYFTAADGRLLAVNARRGTRGRDVAAARTGLGHDRALAAAPVATGGRVYASAPDGSVFAVDAANPAGW